MQQAQLSSIIAAQSFAVHVATHENGELAYLLLSPLPQPRVAKIDGRSKPHARYARTCVDCDGRFKGEARVAYCQLRCPPCSREYKREQKRLRMRARP